MSKPKLRTVRSFVRRQGRITIGQQRALDQLLPVYGLDEEIALPSLDSVFGRDNRKVLEIGFGTGDSLVQQAQENPDQDYIGIEVHRPGVGHLLAELEERAIDNVRIYTTDALEVLKHCIPNHSLDVVQIFFPDPWHKKRHHKRRLVQIDFIHLLAQKLKPAGALHLATDWQDYAEHVLKVMQHATEFCNTSTEGNFVPRPPHRPLTKFERRGQRLGHGVWDLVFSLIK